MPSNISAEAHPFHHALDIPDKVWAPLRENEAAANVILPFAEKAKGFAREGEDQLWIALYNGDDTKSVEFVLSCTTGPLGNYPIFIVASKSAAQRAQEDQHDQDLAESLKPLVRCLLDEVLAQRVFSVFSIAKVTRSFAEVFVAEARARQVDDIQAHANPYYDATFTFCTEDTFNKPPGLAFPHRESEDITIALRPAVMDDLDALKVLCKEFSKTSPPYELDDVRAELEARTMIDTEQVWVHLIKKDDEREEIACMVAATRESDNVTAVTKVFTAEHWRGNNCATRLLHRVCQTIFRRKDRIVLFVGNSDECAAARRVYHKLGFQGMNELQGGQQIEGVEKWLEIGFKGTKQGHW